MSFTYEKIDQQLLSYVLMIGYIENSLKVLVVLSRNGF